MAAEGQQNTLDSAKKDVSSAVKMGAEAARTAKTVGKVAAQAAAGNVAGAAVTLLKDPKTVRNLLLIILVPIIFFACILVVFLYALPTAIFEAVTSYVDQVKEYWEQGVYSSEGGIFVAGFLQTIKTGGKIIGDAISSVGNLLSDAWNGLVSWFTADSSSGDEGARVDDNIEELDDEALHVTQDETAETNTLLAKVDACKQKISLRQSQIKEAIQAKQGEIDQIFRNKFAGTYDVWGGTTLNILAPEVSQSEAIRLLSAYTVIEGASLQDMRLSDFLKWLGYYREFTGNHTVFNLGGDTLYVEPAVKTWCGTFMPQYLVEQRNQDIEARIQEADANGETYDKDAIRADVKKEYEQYQGPATDLLLTVDCQDFTTVPPIYTIVSTEDGGSYIVCSVSITITIGTRSVNDLASNVIGFWSGSLNSSQEDAGQPDAGQPDADQPAA